MNGLIFNELKLFTYRQKHLFHFDLIFDSYKHIREYSRAFSNVLVQFLIDKYLPILSERIDLFQYGAKEERT